MNKLAQYRLIEKVALSPQLRNRADRIAGRRVKKLTRIANKGWRQGHVQTPASADLMATARKNQARIFKGRGLPPYARSFKGTTGDVKRLFKQTSASGEYRRVNKMSKPFKRIKFPFG